MVRKILGWVLFPFSLVLVAVQAIVILGLLWVLPAYNWRKHTGRSFMNVTNWVGWLGPFALLIVNKPSEATYQPVVS